MTDKEARELAMLVTRWEKNARLYNKDGYCPWDQAALQLRSVLESFERPERPGRTLHGPGARLLRQDEATP